MNIILDVGSGNTLRNDVGVVKELIDAIKDQDTGKHDVWIKAQLFEHQPPNEPLHYDIFDYLFFYAAEKGYKVTASVFDRNSLHDLLTHDPEWVKIACRPELYYLIGEIPRKYKVHVSLPFDEDNMGAIHYQGFGIRKFCCVPRYPAKKEEYQDRFKEYDLDYAISDHTVGLELFNIYQPEWFEKHVVLKREASNPDSGKFALTVKELRELL